MESIAGKYWFVTGGILLALFGTIFLINDIVVLRSFGPLQDPATGWEKAFRIGVIALPVLWIVSGTIAVLLGRFGTDGLFTVANRIGTPVNTVSTLMLCGYVAAWNAQSLPFFENLGSWFRFAPTTNAMWVAALILIAAGQMCFVGFEINSKTWEDRIFWESGISKAALIVIAATRMLFILMLLPILSEGFGSDSLAGLPPLVYAYLGMIGMGIFVLVGDVGTHKITAVKILGQRFKAAIAITVYIIAVILVFHPIILWLCYSAPGIIQVGVCVLLLVGTFSQGGGTSAPSSGGTGHSPGGAQGSDDGNVVCQWCGYRKLANQPYCPNCNNKGIQYGNK